MEVGPNVSVTPNREGFPYPGRGGGGPRGWGRRFIHLRRQRRTLKPRVRARVPTI
jgi:hypothetical protein